MTHSELSLCDNSSYHCVITAASKATTAVTDDIIPLKVTAIEQQLSETGSAL